MTHGTTRRRVIGGGMAAGLGLVADRLGATASAAPARPNILFILADDLGYADLSCYGARGHRTPMLDQLAADGMKLTQAYANSAVCSATRMALITGRYQYRLRAGLQEPIPGYDPDLGLPSTHPTLPGQLRAAGYDTALIGKWHLGAPPRFGPLKSGYDHFFGFYQGAIDYFRHGANLEKDEEKYGGLFENDRAVSREGYLTDLLADETIRRIQKGGPRPFFISLHFNAPHWPWEGPDDIAHAAKLKGLRDTASGNLAKYGEMVEAMDSAIGRVLDALRRSGAADDTIVVFTSDNGGERFSDVWPFVGMKGELLEGGLRVPAIVRWPRRIARGSTSDQVMASMDWMPTLLQSGGGTVDPAYPSDGIDIMPQLLGSPSVPRTLFWRYHANDQAAIRSGNLKYLKIGDYEYLFDVVKDSHERANLRSQFPEEFEKMKNEYLTWAKTMLKYPKEFFSESPKGKLSDRY